MPSLVLSNYLFINAMAYNKSSYWTHIYSNNGYVMNYSYCVSLLEAASGVKLCNGEIESGDSLCGRLFKMTDNFKTVYETYGATVKDYFESPDLIDFMNLLFDLCNDHSQYILNMATSIRVKGEVFTTLENRVAGFEKILKYCKRKKIFVYATYFFNCLFNDNYLDDSTIVTGLLVDDRNTIIQYFGIEDRVISILNNIATYKGLALSGASMLSSLLRLLKYGFRMRYGFTKHTDLLYSVLIYLNNECYSIENLELFFDLVCFKDDRYPAVMKWMTTPYEAKDKVLDTIRILYRLRPYDIKQIDMWSGMRELVEAALDAPMVKCAVKK